VGYVTENEMLYVMKDIGKPQISYWIDMTLDKIYKEETNILLINLFIKLISLSLSLSLSPSY